jgi:hypothetical protein
LTPVRKPIIFRPTSELMWGTTMTAEPASAAGPVDRNRLLGIGAAASILHLLLMIPGYNEDGDFDAAAWVVVLLISLVVSLALFLFVVPRANPVTALVLGVVALLSVLVFWAGLTLPLAAAGWFSAWRAREAGPRSGLVTAALALSVVAAVAVVAIIIGDAASN